MARRAGSGLTGAEGLLPGFPKRGYGRSLLCSWLAPTPGHPASSGERRRVSRWVSGLLPAFLLRGVNLEMKLKILLCSCRGEGGTHNRLRALPLPPSTGQNNKGNNGRRSLEALPRSRRNYKFIDLRS